MTRRWDFISDNRVDFGVQRICRVLQVSRSGYYRWLAGTKARVVRRAADDALVEEIREIHTDHKGTYGVRRVHAELRGFGHTVNRKRVERLMRINQIEGRHLRRRKRTTVPDRLAPPAPDLVSRNFSAGRLDEKWCGDITLFASRSFSAVMVIAAVSLFGFTGVAVLVVMFYNNVQHLNALDTSWRMLPLFGVYVVTAFLTGRVIRRTGFKAPLTLGLLLGALAVLGLTTVGADTPYSHVRPLFVLFGRFDQHHLRVPRQRFTGLARSTESGDRVLQGAAEPVKAAEVSVKLGKGTRPDRSRRSGRS